jgi:glycosyltransferase involved in cell wall biosynthesis
MAIRVVSIISRMNVGGPAVLLSELIKNLPPEEFEHVLITGTCLPNEIDYLDSHPLDSAVIYIDEIKRSILPLNDVKSFFKLIRILKQLHPDIVHTHTSKAGVLGRLAAKVAVPTSKIIHTYHGHLLYGYFPKWKTFLIVQLEKFLGSFSDRLVAVTKQVREDLLGAGIGKANQWLVIRPGLELTPLPDRAAYKKTLGINADKFVISWIGRFTGIKNPKLALEAISKLPLGVLEKVAFVMTGSGELLEEAQSYARQMNLPITFTGWITDINPILGASDLLFMSSKNEGMPVVIVEAALRKVPTLSTNVGGVKEFIKDNETGWLSRQVAEDIATHIASIFNGYSRSLVPAKAYELARAEFGIANMTANHRSLYSSWNIVQV